MVKHNEPASMCNVEVMVEQPQCVSIYKEFVLISEQPLTGIDIAHLIRDSSNIFKFRNTRLIKKMRFKRHALIWAHINF